MAAAVAALLSARSPATVPPFNLPEPPKLAMLVELERRLYGRWGPLTRTTNSRPLRAFIPISQCAVEVEVGVAEVGGA